MIKSRFLYIVLISLIMLNCSEDRADRELGSAIPEPQTTHSKSELLIGPKNATVRTIISLKAMTAIINEGIIYWSINGHREEASDNLRFSSEQLKKGDVLQAILVNGEKEYLSNEIIIKNTPPVIERSRLVPDRPLVSSIITVEIKTGDADNDSIFYKYEWTVNGKFAGEGSYLETDLKRGDTINLKVIPFDGEDEGRTITLSSEVHNSLPVFTDSDPVFEGKIYKYRINAADPDGDTLTFTLEKGPEGMVINSETGDLRWELRPKDTGSHDIEVSVDDGHGGQIFIPFSTRISFKEQQAAVSSQGKTIQNT